MLKLVGKDDAPKTEKVNAIDNAMKALAELNAKAAAGEVTLPHSLIQIAMGETGWGIEIHGDSMTLSSLIGVMEIVKAGLIDTLETPPLRTS